MKFKKANEKYRKEKQNKKTFDTNTIQQTTPQYI